MKKKYPNLWGYSEVDWARCPINRRSTTRNCIPIGGNIISWKSKKQIVVAQSNAKAKYRIMKNH